MARIKLLLPLLVWCLAGCALEPPRPWLQWPPGQESLQVSASIVEETDGFRIERRTVNIAPNGDFASAGSPFWIHGANVTWQATGGIDDSPCLKLMPGQPLALAMTGLEPGIPHALQLYVKGNAQPRLTWNDQMLEARILTKGDWTRLGTVVYPALDCGTLRLTTDSPLLLDDVQFDPGVAFFNSVVPPGRKRPVDRLELTPPGQLSQQAGTFRCRLQVPWLQADAVATEGFGLLQAIRQTPSADWKANLVMSISARHPPDEAGMLYVQMMDQQDRYVVLKVPFIAFQEPLADWHELAVTWELRAGDLHLAAYVDGKLANDLRTPFGPPREADTLYIGYTGGAYLNGLLNDVHLYDHPLTTQQLAAATHPGSTP